MTPPTSDAVPLIGHSMDLSTYVVNGEWTIISSPAENGKEKKSHLPGFNLIIPSILICVMTVFGFSLPPDAGEKITLRTVSSFSEKFLEIHS
ncbi:hypothetical protein ANCCEY_02455 [Ancylostoma ceylanicum]|uniref:Neurotransmitter-gated ion-channel transmembrane domain-containing protein n=1 Tax=Ancylostoma ceylanicum TaxID=53326 RepID=A0A0D6M2N4_9BILA|nr:hypothetical protein ANCCEY_02455 [Ancylostoma ceylanicum]